MGFQGEISQMWSMLFFILEEAGACLAEANNDIFNFENGYKVPRSRHKGCSICNKEPTFLS